MDRLQEMTIGIPTCDDDPRVLSLALDALAREQPARPPVIVDMSATDRIERLVEARPERLRYTLFRESSGVADSRNRIFELADTRYLAFIDADAVPLPGWAKALSDAFADSPDTVLVGTRIIPAWPHPAPAFFGTPTALELLGMLDVGPDRRELPRVMGTSYAVDCERLPRVPPFRVDLGRRPGQLLAWEEVQLSLDVLAAGGRIRYEPKAIVSHHIKPDRLTWRWMMRRAHVAGRESHLSPGRLEPFPRRLTLRDGVFRLATSPAFLTGRLRGVH